MADTLPLAGALAEGLTLGTAPAAEEPAAFEMPALIGTTIEHYRLVRCLGAGGMATVFYAVHEELGRQVAIKVLEPDLCREPQTAARFFNEARAASLISHPSVVSIVGFGRLPPQQGGLAYTIMEYLEGETLAGRFERLGQRYDRSYVRLLRQVATGMAAVHEQGIVHRDLKLQNLMIVPDPEAPGGERVKILDFGIAKLRREHYPAGHTEVQTRQGSLLGTAVYMSPEQCAGGEITAKADVYSLGALSYRLLSGQPLFPDQDLREVLRKQVHVEPIQLFRLAPLLPRGLCHLVHAMLAKDPTRRPTMAQVANALEEWEDPARLPSSIVPPQLWTTTNDPDATVPGPRIGGLPLPRPATAAERPATRFVSANWLAWALGLAALLIVLAAIFGLVLRGR